MGLEVVGEGDEGNGVVFKAISATTLGTGEMDVVEVMAVFTTADAVLENAGTVINLVQ